jgi:translation initiation factor 1
MSRKSSKKLPLGGGMEFGTNPFADLKAKGLPEASIASPQKAKLPPAVSGKQGRVEIRREKAGRGGKTVTTLSAFATHHTVPDLDRLLQALKKLCACGGTLKGRVIELQGDVCDRVLSELAKRGFKAVRAGG